jgi:hypothetical protein
VALAATLAPILAPPEAAVKPARRSRDLLRRTKKQESKNVLF